jgi:hypothetical protein
MKGIPHLDLQQLWREKHLPQDLDACCESLMI